MLFPSRSFLYVSFVVVLCVQIFEFKHKFSCLKGICVENKKKK